MCREWGSALPPHSNEVVSRPRCRGRRVLYNSLPRPLSQHPPRPPPPPSLRPSLSPAPDLTKGEEEERGSLSPGNGSAFDGFWVGSLLMMLLGYAHRRSRSRFSVSGGAGSRSFSCTAKSCVTGRSAVMGGEGEARKFVRCGGEALRRIRREGEAGLGVRRGHKGLGHAPPRPPHSYHLQVG